MNDNGVLNYQNDKCRRMLRCLSLAVYHEFNWQFLKIIIIKCILILFSFMRVRKNSYARRIHFSRERSSLPKRERDVCLCRGLSLHLRHHCRAEKHYANDVFADTSGMINSLFIFPRCMNTKRNHHRQMSVRAASAALHIRNNFKCHAT